MRIKNVIQKTVLSAALFAILPATSAHAAVPGLINYQGRLADANGAPVTGSKNFTLSIYDGETEGSLLYSEDIGAVTLDDNGVYNFQFGESGTSQATATKSVGVADGIKNVFNTVLPDSAMGVSSIGDGTYTWTPTNGSSSPTSFIGSYDAASKTVSAIYIGAVPEAGTEITVNYQNSTSGIAAALASGSEQWLQLSIDGTQQASRTKILSVPFASVADVALSVKADPNARKENDAIRALALESKASSVTESSAAPLSRSSFAEAFESDVSGGVYGVKGLVDPLPTTYNKNSPLEPSLQPNVSFRTYEVSASFQLKYKTPADFSGSLVSKIHYSVIAGNPVIEFYFKFHYKDLTEFETQIDGYGNGRGTQNREVSNPLPNKPVDRVEMWVRYDPQYGIGSEGSYSSVGDLRIQVSPYSNPPVLTIKTPFAITDQRFVQAALLTSGERLDRDSFSYYLGTSDSIHGPYAFDESVDISQIASEIIKVKVEVSPDPDRSVGLSNGPIAEAFSIMFW